MARDRAQEIIERGDPREIIAVGLRARSQAEEGLYCECDEPILTGRDLMCGACLRENQTQIGKRTREIREPHAFEPRGQTGIKAKMCRVCSHWEDDPRHLHPASVPSGSEKGGER
jgi:hypothetical protein